MKLFPAQERREDAVRHSRCAGRRSGRSAGAFEVAAAAAAAILVAGVIHAAPAQAASTVGSTVASVNGSPAAAPTASPSAPPAEFIIQGGQVYPVSSEMVDGGAVWVKDGKIFQVGRIEAVQGGRIMTCVDGCALQVRDDMPMVNVGDAWIVPGLIDAGTSLGLPDMVETRTTTGAAVGAGAAVPAESLRRVSDGLRAQSPAIEQARAAGITTVLVVPPATGTGGAGSGGVLAGESALIDLAGDASAERLVKSPAGVHADLRENPEAARGATAGIPAQGATRAAGLRGVLKEARAYREKWVKYREDLAASEGSASPQGTTDGGAKAPTIAAAAGSAPAAPPERPATDPRLEALVPVLTGEIPLVVRAERVAQIQAALAIAGEYGVRMILEGGTEAWKLAGEITDKRIPVLLGPVTAQAPGRDSPATGRVSLKSEIDAPLASYEGAAKLQEAGARIALQTGEARPARRLAFETGLAVAAGLPWEDALRAVTLSPAEILGVDDRIGSLAIGREANILVTSGDPFEPATRIVQVYVRGVPVLAAGPRAEPPARRDAK